MIKRIIPILFLSIILSPLAARAQVNLKVNSQAVEENQALNIFGSDLDMGKIFFSLSSSGLKKAEVSLDRGRNWEAMDSEKDYFSFGYRPFADEIIFPEFLLTGSDGKMQTYRPNLKINFQKRKPDDAVAQVLDKMKMYYENEDIDNFMNVFSMSYPDRVKFKESIQNDFYNYKNIRLRYRVDRKTFDEDYEGAIWDIYWERKYDNRTGTSFSDSANIAMRFDKESGNWQITGLRNNTIFGSSLLVVTTQADLTLSSSDITGGYVGLDYVINAVIHNNGTAAANNFKVRFKSGLSFDDTVTVVNLSASSSTTVNYTTPGTIPPFTVEVTADSTSVVSESDETNNTASKPL